MCSFYNKVLKIEIKRNKDTWPSEVTYWIIKNKEVIDTSEQHRKNENKGERKIKDY